MNATNAGAAPGALFYMAGSSIVATSALTGVLKGNGAGAPAGGAFVSDLQETVSYKQYDQTNVPITGVRISGTSLRLISYSLSYLKATLVPGTPTGQMYFCNSCVPVKIAVSTGTAAGDVADVRGGQLQ
ncbi:MAG: hypothetical protein NTY77_02920 [Elusimicrobia bacterium]|nr:hypothetical protein [Elusimicrobiota bacterium]